MGLLDNSGDILVDAVLTDLGREFLARNDGSFEVVRYAFGDDEIDYGLFVPNTGSLQQDTNIMNTPIFEAFVNEKIALRNQLISISNPDLKYLPSLDPSNTAVTLGEKNDSQVGKTVEFKQSTQSSRTVPSEIVDASFIIEVNNSLLFVEKQTPVSISPFGTATYIVPRTAIAANQGAQVGFNVVVQGLSSELWDTLGSGSKGSRTISTKVTCKGVLSGLSGEVSITINEEYSR